MQTDWTCQIYLSFNGEVFQPLSFSVQYLLEGITGKDTYLSHHTCMDYIGPEAMSCNHIGMKSFENCRALLNFAWESTRLWDRFSMAMIIDRPESWSSLHYFSHSGEVLYCAGYVLWNVRWNSTQMLYWWVFFLLILHIHLSNFPVLRRQTRFASLLVHKWTLHNNNLEDLQEPWVTTVLKRLCVSLSFSEIWW